MLFYDGLILNNLKFSKIIQDQYTRYQQSLPLRFIDRLPMTPADDDELTSYYTGRITTAPLVADDQEAPVFEIGQLETVTNVIPNIKHGKRFGQQMLNRMQRIKSNMAGATGDVAMFENWEVVAAVDLISGVRQRLNALACGMMIDSLNYSSYGIKAVGTWGMPSDLKFTPASAWSSISSTPITDILTALQFAATNYGETYDRLTLSTLDMTHMAGTTEFKQLIPGLVNEPIPTTGYNAYMPRMRVFASQLLNMEIEVEDRLMFSPSSAGTQSTARVLPTGTVLFSNKSDDNNMNAMDMANGVVTESLVASIVGRGGADLGGPRFGPVGYYTGKEDLNPPNLLAWAVARCFPRKFRKTATAVMTGV